MSANGPDQNHPEGNGPVSVSVGDRIRYGAPQQEGIIEHIRIIETNQIVEKFKGSGRAVVVSVREGQTLTMLWLKDIKVQKIVKER